MIEDIDEQNTVQAFQASPEDLAEFPPELLTEDEYAEIVQLYPEQSVDGYALSDPHYQENLAEILEENELATIAQDIVEKYDEDEESRREWREREAEGLRLIGIIDDVGGGAPFDGASIVTHPGLAEAMLQFQAQGIQEFFPPEGPCRTIVTPGVHDPEMEAQAKRVRDFVNYQYTEMMPDAFEDDDQMMLRLPLSGSCFKKVYFDPLEDTVVSEYVEPTYFVAPYGARSLRKCERFTDVLWMNHNEVLRRQEIGEYLPIDLPESTGQSDRDDAREIIDGIDESEGRHQQAPYEDDRRQILQQHVMYNLPGDDRGVKSPYIITVDREMEKVLSIRRNWDRDDENRKRIMHFVHYKFLPGYGFYGWGLLHIMGSLAMAMTGNLRALLDSAAFANMQGGLSSGRMHIKGRDVVPAPGEWVKVDMPDDDIRKAFFSWPYKEPSPTLFQLLRHLDDLGRRIGNITNITSGQENPRNAPVGTVLALIEQSNIRPTAIHKRLFNSRKKELRLICRLNAMYLPNRYPYAMPDGVKAEIFAQDFDGRVDVLPIADPQVISGMQRIAQAQALVERAQANPDIYDRKAAELRLLQSLRIPQHESLILPEQEPQPPPRQDPVTENMSLQTGAPVQAYPDQDHNAHIIVHSHWLDQIEGQAEEVEMLRATAIAHIAQHRALLYQNEMMAAMGQQIPPGGEMPPEMEAQLSQMAAQVAQMMPKKANQADMALERDQARKDAQARATESRKDAQAMSEIARRNMMAQSEVNRKKDQNVNDMMKKVAEAEFDMTQKAMSKTARDTMSAEGAVVNSQGTIPL